MIVRGGDDHDLIRSCDGGDANPRVALGDGLGGRLRGAGRHGVRLENGRRNQEGLLARRRLVQILDDLLGLADLVFGGRDDHGVRVVVHGNLNGLVAWGGSAAARIVAALPAIAAARIEAGLPELRVPAVRARIRGGRHRRIDRRRVVLQEILQVPRDLASLHVLADVRERAGVAGLLDFLEQFLDPENVAGLVRDLERVGPLEELRLAERREHGLDFGADVGGGKRLQRADHALHQFRLAAANQLARDHRREQRGIELFVHGPNRERRVVADEDELLEDHRLVEQIGHFAEGELAVLARLDGDAAGGLHRRVEDEPGLLAVPVEDFLPLGPVEVDADGAFGGEGILLGFLGLLGLGRLLVFHLHGASQRDGRLESDVLPVGGCGLREHPRRGAAEAEGRGQGRRQPTPQLPHGNRNGRARSQAHGIPPKTIPRVRQSTGLGLSPTGRAAEPTDFVRQVVNRVSIVVPRCKQRKTPTRSELLIIPSLPAFPARGAVRSL